MPDERWTFLNMNDRADKQTEPYRFFGTQEEGIVGKRDLSYDDAQIPDQSVSSILVLVALPLRARS